MITLAKLSLSYGYMNYDFFIFRVNNRTSIILVIMAIVSSPSPPLIIVIIIIMFMIIIKLIMAPVELSDNSAKSKQSNNFESTEQRSDTLQDVKLFYK